MTKGKKRLVIDDDDDDDKDEHEFSSAEGQKRSLDERKEKGKDRITRESVADYLKRRKAKSEEAAKQQKRIKLTNEDDNNKSPSKSSSQNKAIKKEQSIPKKSPTSQSIPKKSNENDGSGRKRNAEEVTKKETTSLLSGMKKPPAPKATHNKKDKPRSLPSSRAPIHMSKSKSPPTPLPDSTSSTKSPVPPDLTSSRVDVDGERVNKFSGLRQIVFDGLKDLCKDAIPNPPEHTRFDLFGSFLRHKHLKKTLNTGSNDSDGNSNLQYDFFDLDEKSGSIVLQPKIPIFPEEFPQGKREWPLSWWGIVDPSVEGQIVETEPKIKRDTDKGGHTKPRRERSEAQSGWKSPGRKDGSTDRIARSDRRNTRKRSSRDHHDDEFPSYDGYHFREDNRDRFPAREKSGAGYPPQFRGNDNGNYDYGHNDFRNPHRRGGFPHRAGDGPPPHSRPYPRDGGPPGDFRGRPRSYPGHGSGPAWDYQHGDQHGPQGRGPPISPHDDRRDNHEVDRPRRSPYSKPARDGGRNLGRELLSNSNRKI
mmetsp:Transcript_19270/g.53706  ORF Transcript_19270/g.53706 Transcript_19270/m.53706 type:complete len:534 (-) Transcript_19270:1643-3244(-)